MVHSRPGRGSPTTRYLGAPMALLLLVAGACTTALYNGPARGPINVARLSPASGTKVTEVDGRPVESGRFTVYEIEPGRHKLVAAMKDDSSLTPALRKANAKPPLLCFEAEATHTYEVSVTVVGSRLHASINDQVPGFDVVVGGGCGAVLPVEGWDFEMIQPIYPIGNAFYGEPPPAAE